MNLENRVWQAISLAVIILTGLAPIYVTYDLFVKGPIPERRVELYDGMVVNPLKELSTLGEKVSLSISFKDETINNLVIKNNWLRNAGESPIVPDDYCENISVSVSEPWKILTVESTDEFSTGIKFKWTKVTDTRFEAQPALLNPGDIVTTAIYLTNTEFKGSMDYDVYRDVKVKWNARITNLRFFSKWPSILDESRTARTWTGIIVHLSGWALPFTLLTAVLFLCLYLYLLFRSALLMTISLATIPLIAVFSLLSFSAAEVIAYYLFKPFPSYLKPYIAFEWINWVVFGVHIATIIYLYRRMVQHKRMKVEFRG